MAPKTFVNKKKITMLLDRLGYRREAGWIDADDFDGLASHRFAMQQARDEMSVIGAFCLHRKVGETEAMATPLVYVATSLDPDGAKEIHRRVWSQGIVPFLLVLTPEGIARCHGFSFSNDKSGNTRKWFNWKALDLLPPTPTEAIPLNSPGGELWDLRAIRLRTSLFWRDHSIDVKGRVDIRLLESLENLSQLLINGHGVSHRIGHQAANGLIGRFLYVFFLTDRGIINQEWVSFRGHIGIDLENREPEWSAQATWDFFDDLDSIFNGSVFPLSVTERIEIDETHINLVRRVMKYEDEPLGSGAVQLSFLKFFFGALRTETLSAIYEQFLENIKPGERTRLGAFYTPPFLVDFMLDRVDEARLLQDGVTLLDPAAGSGVFLVGAYRRLIERTLSLHHKQNLDLDELRRLLLDNIFGIEQNLDACHVAAFSLYLTMLDYAHPRDLKIVAAGMAPEKLFPQLIGSNLFAEDFFDDINKFKGLPRRVLCIVGNPPWQKIDKLGSKKAKEWLRKNRGRAPIGRNQIAELFIWKAMLDHLDVDGILGFLLPTKSFINSNSSSFRIRLTQEYTVFGAANFSHFRYRLFGLPKRRQPHQKKRQKWRQSRQAAMAVLVRNRTPTSGDPIWVYSPLSVGQPVARQQWPWTIMLDRSDVHVFRNGYFTSTPQGWFEAFMLRPVDRQIRQFLIDASEEGKISLLGNLCEVVGAKLGRGRDSGATGIDSQYLMNAPIKMGREITERRQSEIGLIPDADNQNLIKLPLDQLKNVKPNYRNKFSGNVLIVPRNFSDIRFVNFPAGFTSAISVFYFDKPAQDVTSNEKQLLRGIERFFCSNTAQYLVAITGRRWLMDRRNIELEDLEAFPVPFTGLDDPKVRELLKLDEQELEEYIMDSLGLDGDLKLVVEEFLDFRGGFRDGGVPEKALIVPKSDMITAYLDILRFNLDGLLGREGAFVAASEIDQAMGVGAVATCFQEESESKGRKEEVLKLCRDALDRYATSSANNFSDSLSASYDAENSQVSFVKPLEFFRWTVDSAHADSRQMMDIFLSERS